MNTPSIRAWRARPRPRAGRHAATLPAAWLACGTLFLIGCLGSSTTPTTTDRPYDGPPVELVAADAAWGVQVTAPGGGWSLRVDRVLDRFRESQVYVTIAEPYSGFGYPTQPVVQRGATGCSTARAATLLVRRAGEDAYSVVQRLDAVAPESLPGVAK